METLRPDWTVLRYQKEKLDLSNNICYDRILIEDVRKLFSKSQFRQYPDEAKIYFSLSRHYEIDAKNIAIGYGIGELITRILKLPSLRKISILSPTWPMVEVFSKIFSLPHSLDHDNSSNFLYLANPNGVDGSIISKDVIERFLSSYELVIVDEAYAEFSKTDQSVIDLVGKYDNLIVLKTFSKSLSLAGLRLGYAFSNKSLIADLQLTRPSCVTNGMLTETIDELLSMIPAHVDRMNKTKSILESSYICNESNGNFVLFRDSIQSISDTFLVKNIPDIGMRMALVDELTLYQCLNR